ncbi:MAG: hypothetical protein A2176_16250 [Spirochaetes bacterium RBG_13_51_14]|nr:MAG: hypothetical protein A2176_16250 [Spirochaetes bacterium RBG_13_51_14]
MKKKILMIYPEIPTTYWSFKYILKMLGKKTAFPPLGLMTVAALVPDDYDVVLVDMNAAPLKERDILKADLVFVSAMIIQKESFERVVAICNRLGRTVVAGGPYPSGSYRSIAGVDHFVLGEAEATLPDFLRDWERGEARPLYMSEVRPDITRTPVPRFGLVNNRHYTTMSLQYSRGCPFNCEFCDIIELFGRVSRTKEPEQFIAEMDALYRTGFRGPLFIVDDNFIGNKKNVKKLLPAMARWQKQRAYPFMITTEASVNLAEDDELMDMMVEAGFTKVFLGIETPVEESLVLSQKKQNAGIELLAGVEKIQRKGMEVSAGFILGFDSDPDDVFDLQIEFIRKSGIPLAMVGLLTALPNTQLYRRLESENRIIKETSGNNTHDFQLNFLPIMETEALIRGYKKVISSIYSPEEYLKRCLVLIERMPKGKVNRGALCYSTIVLVVRIFLFSLFRQTFSSYGIHYLSYLAAAVKMRRGLFPKAVKMALVGHHFHRITYDILAADDFSASLENLRKSVCNRIERVRYARLEDIVRDVLTLEQSILEKAFIIGIQKKYRKLHDDFRSIVEEPMKRLMDEFKAYIEVSLLSMKSRIERREAGFNGSLDEIRSYCRGLERRIRRKYRYLHRDFREQIDGLLEFYVSRVNRILLELERQYGMNNQ